MTSKYITWWFTQTLPNEKVEDVVKNHLEHELKLIDQYIDQHNIVDIEGVVEKY